MSDKLMPLVVCGAHLLGMPLNVQLTERGGTLIKTTTTEKCYRLYALPGAMRRPGLVRVNDGGQAIVVEVWLLPEHSMGSFLAGIAPPLGLGSVLLADKTVVTGFICECYGLEGAVDITHYGGWRAYIADISHAKN